MSLPGVNTVIKDTIFSVIRTNTPLGPRVGIIGRRNDPDTVTNAAGAADLDPYNASNEQDVIAVFGAESDLHRGYLEAISGGATRITLIALPYDTEFDHANGTIESADYTALVGSNTLFDDAFSAAEAVALDIIVPWGRGSSSSDFLNPATPNQGAATPSYGEVSEVGFHANNSTNVDYSWAAKVARKCYDITKNSYPCFGILGVLPYLYSSTSDGGMTPANVAAHLTLSSDTFDTDFDYGLVGRDELSFLDDNGIEILYGSYLSVVAGEISPLGYNKTYDFGYSNGAAVYAGHICQLDASSAPTGKVIYNIEKIRYNPTRAQQEALITAGVVPIALNYNRIPSWIDALTFSEVGADYSRLTTLRIVFSAVQMVRAVAQQFVGESSNTQTRNALDTAITSGLRTMQLSGSVLDSDFTVSYIPRENKAIIDLVLRPAFELRNIEVRVAIDM